MMVDIPLPPTITKYSAMVYPGPMGEAVLFHGIHGSNDLIVTVWRLEKDNSMTQVLVETTITKPGQITLHFTPHNPNDPSTQINLSYKVVVMG